MRIELKKITVRDLVAGYTANEAAGVVGYDGQLNIRPAYQRDFVYNNDQRNKVIETLRKGFPLNVMYWVQNDMHKKGPKPFPYEVLDGQQRTLSICRYVATRTYSVNGFYFDGLTDVEQTQILDYELMVYFCEGTDKEKLDWFETINTEGVPLSKQELLNAIYPGPWLSDAKRFFSPEGCAAWDLGNKYLNVTPIRQAYLETAIKWINDGEVRQYMADHQLDDNASELREHYEAVIDWVDTTFDVYRAREMRPVKWGPLYKTYRATPQDPAALEAEIKKLMEDEDVTSKSGIYPYVLSRNERHLNLRLFSDKIKRTAYERQGGLCAAPACGKPFKLEEMEGDHIKPWHEGGQTLSSNCQMLCKACNRAKGGQ